ncbi:hypothetical protein JW887_00545 [Candidatus Dojkabacteria bacterium]|nr:hypothetical protein [Candidatus Dojkabacteria bacterium]
MMNKTPSSTVYDDMLVIQQKDFEAYRKGKDVPKIDQIWRNHTNKLAPEQRKEALKKGYKIVKHDSLHEDSISIPMKLISNNPSKELINELQKYDAPILLVIKD